MRKIHFHGQDKDEKKKTWKINFFKYLKIAIIYDQVNSPRFGDFSRFVTQSACLPRKNVTSWKILRYHLVSSSSRSYKFNYDPDTKK